MRSFPRPGPRHRRTPCGLSRRLAFRSTSAREFAMRRILLLLGTTALIAGSAIAQTATEAPPAAPPAPMPSAAPAAPQAGAAAPAPASPTVAPPVEQASPSPAVVPPPQPAATPPASEAPPPAQQT